MAAKIIIKYTFDNNFINTLYVIDLFNVKTEIKPKRIVKSKQSSECPKVISNVFNNICDHDSVGRLSHWRQ